MCGVVNILEGYELSSDTVKRILDEIASWKWDSTIVITGGEPFLREDIFDIIDHGSSLGLKLEVVSNGSLITPALSKKIIASGLKNIAISLDGSRKESHDLVRAKGAFEKALDAIKNLAASKRALKSGPQISVWTTIMKENVNELFEMIPLVKNLGVECLVYHPVVVAQEDMQNTSSEARFWLNNNDLEVLKKQVAKISSYEKHYGLVAFLHDPYMWVKHFKQELTKKEWKCNPFVFINVGPDGNVRSCGAAFGNIIDSSLGDCLKSSQADKARKIMKGCRKPCLQTCWANPEADSLPDIIDTFIRDLRRDKPGAKEKNEVLTAALAKLTEYEELVKECEI